jgi:Anti-sigma factor NepR
MPGQDLSTQQTGAVLDADQPEQARKFYVVHNGNDRGNDVAAAPKARGRGMLDRSLQAQLGNLLRSVFSDVAEEPVPERFVKLLEALADREKNR